MAEEFRVKVLEDALKMNSQKQKFFEWDILNYPTNNDQTKQQIKSLDQLKRVNKEENNCLAEIASKHDECLDTIMNEENDEDNFTEKVYAYQVFDSKKVF